MTRSWFDARLGPVYIVLSRGLSSRKFVVPVWRMEIRRAACVAADLKLNYVVRPCLRTYLCTIIISRKSKDRTPPTNSLRGLLLLVIAF